MAEEAQSLPVAGRLAGGAVIVAAIGAAIFPLYWMLLTSLRHQSVTMVWPPRLLPDFQQLGLSSYVEVIFTTPMPKWFLNSVAIASLSTLATVFIAACAGYALSRSRNVGGRTMGYAILVSKMLPATLLVVPFYVMFHRMGLLNTLYAPVLGNMSFAVPFATWMMKSFFDGIPYELEQAALTDGSSHWQAFYQIVLPLTLPGLAAVTFYTFIVSWNDYIFARTFLAGGEMTTMAVGATQFLSETEMAWNKVMATAVMASLPVAVVFLALERHFVSGITQGHH
ncbi:MAG: carbohydrate ABC transporter permease [Mesorhizobium sp.]|nr:carbohydrate ABC transporter permease [Mesorhizobium sp.]